MSSPAPRISVLMSVLNGMPYVQQTVPSILGQTFADFEFIIVDNCSTDGTREYLQHIARVANRIQLILNEKNLGHSGGLNRGLEACRAEWIARIDADDVALPNRLERQWAFVHDTPGIAVTSCLAYYISREGRRRGKASLDLTSVEAFEKYMRTNEVIGLLHPGVFMRRSVVLEVGGYREQFAGANDIDLWNRISERGHLILVQPEYLLEYRVHPVSISSSKFIETRLKYEWVRACMVARRSGKAEPAWEAFLREWNSAPTLRRINRRRKILAKMYYRLAGEHFISGNAIRGGAYFIRSMALQPGYALWRFLEQAILDNPARTSFMSPQASVLPTAPRQNQEPLSATVVISCYNAVGYIRQAIESWLQQTRRPAEIVVIDDASTDGSSKILTDYEAKGAIRVVRNPANRGRAESVNSVLDTITTRYTVLMDADDVALPERLERQVAFMETHPKVGCSSTFVLYINSHGKKLARGILDLTTEERFKHYLRGLEPFGLFCPGVILRTEVLRNPSLRFRKEFWPADDIDLWNRIAEAGWTVISQPEFLTKYRVHSTSAVTTNAARTRTQFEWVRACLRARRRGEPEPTREQFEESLRELSWLSRMNRARKVAAKSACRSAGFAMGEGQPIRAGLILLKAFCLQPAYVGRRLFQQVVEP